jgi:hypothetical protein
LIGDDHADLAKVLPDRLDLLGGTHEELKVALKLTRSVGLLAPGPFRVPLAHEVVDERLVPLATPIDAAVPLLKPVRIPRDLDVHKEAAMPLKVDALARAVGGEENADRRLLGVMLKVSLDALAIVFLHSAVDGLKPTGLGESLKGESFNEPPLCVAILGEDQDALVVP